MNRIWASRRRDALLQCAPISDTHPQDRAMRVAVHRGRKGKRDAPAFDLQTKFDRAVAGVAKTIPIPPEATTLFVNEKLVAQPEKRSVWRSVRNPTIVAIVLALLVIAGISIHTVMTRLEAFPGSVTARKMLAVAASTRLAQLEPVQSDAGALSDLLFMKHRLEHYDVAPEFAELRTIGYRVFDDEDGRRVAQIGVDEKRMQLFLFPVELSKEATPTEPGEWRFVEHEAWIGAVQQNNGVIFMAAVRGKKKDLLPYLPKKPD